MKQLTSHAHTTPSIHEQPTTHIVDGSVGQGRRLGEREDANRAGGAPGAGGRLIIGWSMESIWSWRDLVGSR